MNPRLTRLESDFEQVKRDFSGHRHIVVTPAGGDPPEKYHITYYVNGICLAPDGTAQIITRHEVDIVLHSDYPRYKPVCRITTPIWHPNFRDGQICIGDIWGAGESLSDIIVNIGDMIQYKSWNAFSPLNADAAKWAIENKHLFPVGNLDLYREEDAASGTAAAAPAPPEPEEAPRQDAPGDAAPAPFGNDFDITAADLIGVTYVPSAQRMQKLSSVHAAKKVNFKTVLVKGILWAFIGALLGFGASELSQNATREAKVAAWMGFPQLAASYDLYDQSTADFQALYENYETYCLNNGLDPDVSDNFATFYGAMDAASQTLYDAYATSYANYDEAIYNAYTNEFYSDTGQLTDTMAGVTRVSIGLWSAILALFIGLMLGVGEGVYYGSVKNAVKYAAIGAGISLVMGFVSGYFAQWLYSTMLSDSASTLAAAFVRGLGWAVLGLGVGGAVGLIKPEMRRLLSCVLGGTLGAFLGGFLFEYVGTLGKSGAASDMISRGVAIVALGILIGVGVGLLEQFAKSAWLKVVRGEFEGKEYLVFRGVTLIGNSGKNTIVLFKDKLVSPHHCEIALEGSRYVLSDAGGPMGTYVNGQRIARHALRNGDSIAVGNTVMVFNSR